MHCNEAGTNCLIYNIDKRSKAYRGKFPFQVLQAVNDKDPGVWHLTGYLLNLCRAVQVALDSQN
jgi:hypothetical protein